MNKVWVPGFEGLYEIADTGELISYLKGTPKTLKQNEKAVTGYAYNILVDAQGNKVSKYRHRLVAEAFVPVPKKLDGMKVEVNHKDGWKLHNAASNLEWVTKAANQRHMVLMGLANPAKGEDNHNSRLTEDQVREIRHRYNVLKQSVSEIWYSMGGLGVSRQTVYMICTYRVWKDLL